MKNYYDILGLSKFEKDQDVILCAYKDKTQSLSGSLYKVDNVQGQLIDLNEAYLVLSDVQIKTRYDYILSTSSSDTILDKDIEEKRSKAEKFILSKLPSPPKKKRKNLLPAILCALFLFSGLGTIVSTCSRSYFESKPYATNLGTYNPNEDWMCYDFLNSYSISIPPTMELRTEYDEYTRLLNNNLFTVSSDVTVFQPKGLSSLSHEAINRYGRVMTEYYKLSPGEVESHDEVSYITEEDRIAFKELVDAELGYYTYTEYPTFRWVNLGDANAIEATYKRTGERGSVTCRLYLIPNYDEMVKIIVSYRDYEDEMWKLDLSNVIRTFKWKNPK